MLPDLTPTVAISGEPWTPADLDRLPDGVNCQIVDGSLLVSPPRPPRHQLVAARLVRLLSATEPDDVETLSAMGVQVGDSFFVPDVVIVDRSVVDRDVDRLDPADVLLVAEIIAPSNAGIDRREKPLRYAEVGIPHFWRVELEGDRSPYVVRYGLDESGVKYRELGTVHAGEEQTVDVGFPVTLRPAEFLGRRKIRG